jgi:hypothetical protein
LTPPGNAAPDRLSAVTVALDAVQSVPLAKVVPLDLRVPLGLEVAIRWTLIGGRRRRARGQNHGAAVAGAEVQVLSVEVRA